MTAMPTIRRQRTSAGSDRTTCGGPAHLHLEPSLGGVTDSADGHTDYLPQDPPAQQRKLSAGLATRGRLGFPAESFIHTIRLKAQRHH
jgi:hypothetical protein